MIRDEQNGVSRHLCSLDQLLKSKNSQSKRSTAASTILSILFILSKNSSARLVGKLGAMASERSESAVSVATCIAVGVRASLAPKLAVENKKRVRGQLN